MDVNVERSEDSLVSTYDTVGKCKHTFLFASFIITLSLPNFNIPLKTVFLSLGNWVHV